jgi:hypothetical protein
MCVCLANARYVCTHKLRIDTLIRFKLCLWTNDDNPLIDSVTGRREGGGARERADGRLKQMKRWLRLRGKGRWLEEECILFGINEPYSISRTGFLNRY